MAKKQPSFITGANAKIKLGGKTMAFATDVSYNVTVQTIPVETFGRYEVVSNEPVSYSVDGTLSVIRYTANASIPTASVMNGTATNGDAPTQVVLEDGGTLETHLNPGLMTSSGTFDLVLYEKISSGTAAADVGSVYTISDCRLTRRGATLNKRGVLVDQYAFVGILGADSDHAITVANSGDTDLSTT